MCHKPSTVFWRGLLCIFLTMLYGESPAFSDEAKTSVVLLDRMTKLVNHWPTGAIEWTRKRVDYGNASVWEREAEERVQAQQKTEPMSTGQVESLRKRYFEEARESYPHVLEGEGKALIRGEEYIETLRDSRGYLYRATWHNNRAVTMENALGGEEDNWQWKHSRAYIYPVPSGFQSVGNPFRRLQWILRDLPGSYSSSELLSSGGDDSVVVSLRKGDKTESAVRFSKRNSLPLEVTWYGINASQPIQTLTIDWTQIDSQWIPVSIRKRDYDEAGSLLEELSLKTTAFRLTDVSDDDLKFDFPPDTYVTDKTVSPSFSYRVKDPQNEMRISELVSESVWKPSGVESDLPEAGASLAGHSQESALINQNPASPEGSAFVFVLGGAFVLLGASALTISLTYRKKRREGDH